MTKKHTRLKIAAFVSAVLLLVALVSGLSLAAGSEKRSGNYGYVVLKDGTAEISKYYGNDAKVTVPSKLGGKAVSSVGTGAFENNEKLTSVTVPSSVKTIGDYAFSSCENLKTVSLPTSLTTIGDSAFMFCPAITSITIPSGVTKIGARAFYCDGLTKLALPNSVKSIGAESFSSCQELLEVKMGNNLTSIGDSAFSNCQKLTKATLPSNLKKIPDNLFYQCLELKTVNFPSGLTEIGFGAFSSTAITAAPLPNTVKIIGEEAFNWAQKLKSVNLPEGLTEISSRAFSSTTLESVKLPSTIKKIGVGAFSGSMIKELTIPNGVTEIHQEAFQGCHELTKVTLPDTVTVLGERVFERCDKLTDIRLPQKLKAISNRAFYECRGLQKISIPNSVTSIGQNAFYYCLKLENVTLSNKLKTIGDYAFSCCTKLSSLTLPDTVEDVGAGAFAHTAIKTMSCPKSLKKCGYNPFLDTPFSAEQSKGGIYWGKWLIGYEYFTDTYDYETDTYKETKVTIKDGTVAIANHVFCPVVEGAYPYVIRSISIPNSVTYIGDMAFHGAEITSLTVPDSVTDIGAYAFSDCYKLTKLTLSKNLKIIRNHVFSNCESLKTIKIPSSVKQIESQAFWNTKVLNDQKGNKSIYVDNWLISVDEVKNYTYTVKDGVVGIADNAVHPLIYDVTVPKSVKYIPQYTFGYGSTGASYKKLRDDIFVLRCESGSAALDYAKKNGLHYVLIGCKHERISGWITDQKATVYAPGKRHKACLDCGKTVKTGTIAQLKCAAPKLKKAKNVSSGVKITWKKTTGADYYYVYRKTAKTSWKRIAKTSATSYIDKTAKSGTTYIYTVRAVNKAGSSSYNKTGVSVKYLSMPTVKAKNASKSVTVSWKKTKGASGYIVYRKTGNGKWVKLSTLKGASKIKFTDKKVKKGYKYSYTVKAYSGKTYSAYSSKGAVVKR